MKTLIIIALSFSCFANAGGSSVGGGNTGGGTRPTMEYSKSDNQDMNMNQVSYSTSGGLAISRLKNNKSKQIYFQAHRNGRIHFVVAVPNEQTWQIKKYSIQDTQQIQQSTLDSLTKSAKLNNWVPLE